MVYQISQPGKIGIEFICSVNLFWLGPNPLETVIQDFAAGFLLRVGVGTKK